MMMDWPDGGDVIMPRAVISTEQELKNNMSFEEALTFMKQGGRVKRKGWEGYGWVCLADGFENLEAEKFWNPHTSRHATLNGGHATVLKYFLFVNKNHKVQMGWTPTQEDMLTDDWRLLSNA